MAERKQKFNIEVGAGIIAIFNRMETKTIQLFSEFIDNSLQSFIDHKEELAQYCNVRECRIKISWSNDEITIEDNAYGMNEEEFGNALRLNSPAKHYSKGSLSKYGMGLKYAAASLGYWYSIETTTYGSKDLYYGEIDIDDLKTNNPKSLECSIRDVDLASHYTKITIKKVSRKFTIAAQDKLIQQLGIVYEDFFSDKTLLLSINDNKVEFTEPEYRTDDNGMSYVYFINDASFTFNEKKYKYSGYLAILKKGNSDVAGLQLKQNRRVMDLNYKPYQIFGKPNDYRQQRIYGAINFLGDEWIARFDKDGMAWDGTGLEEKFIESMVTNVGIKELLKKAIQLRKKDNPICKITKSCNNATINGINKATYEVGQTISFSVYPNPGWLIKTVKLNGEVMKPVDGHPNSFNFNIEDETNTIKVLTEVDKNYEKTEGNPPTDGKNPDDSKKDDFEPGKGLIDDKNNPKPPVIVKELTLNEKIQLRFKHLQKVTFPGIEPTEGEVYPDGIIIKFKNEEFSFNVKFIYEKYNNDFLTIKEKQPYKNSYNIEINTSVDAYDNIALFGQIKEVLIINAISLALGRFLASKNGVSQTETQTFLNCMNNALKDKGGN